MPLRAIVFDFDGVIANSEPLHFRAFRDVLAEQGVDLTERAYYDRYLGLTIGVRHCWLRARTVVVGGRWQVSSLARPFAPRRSSAM